MKAWILISVLTALALCDGVCPDWRCGDKETMVDGTCMMYSDPLSTVLVSGCGRGKACPLPVSAFQATGPAQIISTLSNGPLSCVDYTPTPPGPIMDRAAGDICRENSECHSGRCNQGICDPSS